MTRTLRLAALAGLAALGSCLVSVAPADATLGYANLCPTLQSAFCGGGAELTLAVDNSSGSSAGDVWRIQLVGEQKLGIDYDVLFEYDSSGDLLGEVPLLGVLGAADIADQVAVDPSDGDVYLSSNNVETRLIKSEGNDAAEVTKLNSSGAVLWQIDGSETPQGRFGFANGVAVDPATGDLFVADIAREMIDEFSPEGKYLVQFPIAESERITTDLAVNREGNLYVGFGEVLTPGLPRSTSLTSQVREYTTTGAPVDCPGGTNVLYESPPGVPESTTNGVFAVDPSNGHLFIAGRSATEGNYITEYPAPCTAPSATFGEGGELGGFEGLGVSAATHTVYASSGAIFGLTTLPNVTTTVPAAGVTHFSAEVSGIVNPEETSVTECEFEYGATLAYGHSVPCAQALPLEGSSPVAVSAKLTGLAPNLLYHYRLMVATANIHRFAEPGSFTTEGFGPAVIGERPVSNVSQFAATLNGTLLTSEALVDYHFEYGTSTAYGQIAPTPDEYTPATSETVPVSQSISGLQAGTTYHYRLVASSPGGANVDGPDETFTTLAVPTPTVATGGASGVGVGAATLGGTIDPHGWNTSYLVEYGASTAYGSSWPTIQVDLGALEGPQPVEVAVSNLQPGTTYHYRLVATNDGGTSYGPDMTFTTGAYPVQAIQEAPVLRTLLVPTKAGSKTVTKKTTKGKKKHKKAKKHKTRK